MRKAVLMGSTLLSFLFASSLLVSPALAATFAADKTYSLDKTQTVNDDFYAAGGSPTISGTILGDTMLAGGTVIFDGTIKDNLNVAGGNISVLGSVGASVRAVGGTVLINSSVGADIVMAGGTLTISHSATVGRDAALFGGNITLDGVVARNVTIRGSSVTINGTINGSVDIEAQSVTLGEHANIRGTLNYKSPKELTKADGAMIGTLTYTQATSSARAGNVLAAVLGIIALIKFVAAAAAVLIFTLFFKGLASRTTHSAMASFWKNLCIGFVALIVIPVAFVVLITTIVGAIPGFLLLLTYIGLLVAASILAAVIAGAMLAQWIVKEPRVSWAWGVLGLLALGIIGLIPIVGWVAGAVFFFVALGQLTTTLWNTLNESIH
jgi:hypothetical protein